MSDISDINIESIKVIKEINMKKIIILFVFLFGFCLPGCQSPNAAFVNYMDEAWTRYGEGVLVDYLANDPKYQGDDPDGLKQMALRARLDAIAEVSRTIDEAKGEEE